MPVKTDSEIFPEMPISGVIFPHSPIIIAAYAWSKQHITEDVYNHAVRSAYWALIFAKKHPSFNQNDPAVPKVDLEAVLLANVLHDIGWSQNPELVSEDKRFEVDGANAAKDFVKRYISENEASADVKDKWDSHRIQGVWNGIALHTTPSIALHASPEIALSHASIMSDFAGPLTGFISEAEYLEVEKAFPLAGFGRDGVMDFCCGLCRNKTSTTFDNFLNGFGLNYGYDGEGKGAEEYRKQWEETHPAQQLLRGLDYLEELVGRAGKGKGA